jgi:hypothetical protein
VDVDMLMKEIITCKGNGTARNPQPTAHEGSKNVEGGENLKHPEGRGE